MLHLKTEDKTKKACRKLTWAAGMYHRQNHPKLIKSANSRYSAKRLLPRNL
jgi:hypothetical protein